MTMSALTPGPELDFCIPSSSEDCTSTDGGATLRRALYDQTSGIFTCPDGTEAKIDLRGCPALNELLDGASCHTTGSCSAAQPPP